MAKTRVKKLSIDEQMERLEKAAEYIHSLRFGENSNAITEQLSDDMIQPWYQVAHDYRIGRAIGIAKQQKGQGVEKDRYIDAAIEYLSKLEY